MRPEIKTCPKCKRQYNPEVSANGVCPICDHNYLTLPKDTKADKENNK